MKTIVWDVDDVLNDLMRSWFEDWVSYGGGACPLGYEQISVNPPQELLGISKPEYLQSLDDFRLSGKAARMQPVPEVFEWFCLHGEKAHNIALTATPLRAGSVSAEWVMRNFGRWIRSFSMVPSQRPGVDTGGNHSSKTEFLRWWGKGDILVDDSEENVTGALSLGLQAVLFPRPWNRAELTIPETLIRLTEMIGGPDQGREG